MLAQNIEDASPDELVKLREKINERLTKVQEEESRKALDEIRSLIDRFGFTYADVFPDKQVKRPLRGEQARVLPVLYRDPESGLGWSGRGKLPRWMVGKPKEEFRIKTA